MRLVFDCGVVLHLKLGNPHFTGPVSHHAPCVVFTGCWSLVSWPSGVAYAETIVTTGQHSRDLGSVALYTTGPLNWWPIGLDCDARHALGIMAGETYRQPQERKNLWVEDLEEECKKFTLATYAGCRTRAQATSTKPQAASVKLQAWQGTCTVL